MALVGARRADLRISSPRYGTNRSPRTGAGAAGRGAVGIGPGRDGEGLDRAAAGRQWPGRSQQLAFATTSGRQGHGIPASGIQSARQTERAGGRGGQRPWDPPGGAKGPRHDRRHCSARESSSGEAGGHGLDSNRPGGDGPPVKKTHCQENPPVKKTPSGRQRMRRRPTKAAGYESVHREGAG